jgi:type I restriction enzyme S subunit
MNAEALLAQYERIAEAPDAIARLRRFVLDLAVRGKLVPQEPGDEPASVLLSRLAQFQRGKGGEAAGGVVASEAFHPLPQTWSWVTVGDVFEYDAGAKREPKDLEPEWWLLELEDVEKDTGRLLERVRVSDRSSLSTKSEFQPGDILYGKLRPYLNKVLVADEPGYSTTEIVAIRPRLPLCAAYCALAFRRPDFVAYVERLGRGTKMPRLRTPDAIAALFPLPPVAEQHRIVAKVDELMALCDRLEAARTAREATRDRLAAASLARLNTPDPETFPSDARFALATLPALTTRPDQIKHLRQTILNLAVRGTLVPQDPRDEPAQRWIARSLGSDKLKSEAEAATESPFVAGLTLPTAWSWTMLGALVARMDAGWSPQCEDRPRSDVRAWGILKTTAVQPLAFDPGQHKELPSKLEPRPQHEAQVGDILVTRAGPKNRVGVSCVVDRTEPRLLISDKLIRVRLLDGLYPRFFALCLNAGASASAVEAAKSGMAVMQMNISQDKLRAIPVPLPPLAEQHRIVAKVNELMALCDALEASLAAATDTRTRLLDATLRDALTSDTQHFAEAAE